MALTKNFLRNQEPQRVLYVGPEAPRRLFEWAVGSHGCGVDLLLLLGG